MITFLISAVVASIFAPVSESNAQTVTVENRATGYFVSVTSPDMVELEVDATPTGSTVISDASTINVVTNAPGGYKLYLSAEDNELKATNSDGTTNSSITQTFKPVTSTSLTNNTWGYSLDNTDTKSWSPVPSVSLPEINGGNTTESYMETKGASLISESNVSNYPTGTDIDIYYGINADTTMPSGTYTTTVTYTAFAEGIPDIYTMQGFTTQECANMDTDEQTQLLDTRNNRTYTIVKARDGNCWMAENLSIYNTTISSEDSNLPEGTTITLPESTTWDNNNTTDMLIHVADGTGQYADKTGEYYGEVYYNWCASIGEENCGKYNVAGTTINQSICPKGWTLPVDGTSTTDKSYYKLLSSYGITTTTQLFAQKSLGFDKYYGAWRYVNNSEVDQGSAGQFWSSTPGAASGAYRMYYIPDEAGLRQSVAKAYGFSLRCVYENRTMSDITYMQDMTTQICNNTTEHYSKNLTDNRDNNSYRVTKLKDGNCWMTQNLKLNGNRTITPANSDVKANVTLPANITSGTSVDTAMHIITQVSGYDGNYYNWCAAIGSVADCKSTTEQTTSICPKGFRLPSNSGYHSYTNLFASYGLPEQSNNSNQVNTIMSSPLNFGLNGAYWNGYSNVGANGRYWSRTSYDSSQANGLGYDAGSYGTNGYGPKARGRSVRCVSR